MASKVMFEIKLEGVSKNVIVPKLEALDYTIALETREMGKKDADPNHIMCESVLTDVKQIGSYMNSLYRIDGIVEVAIVHIDDAKVERRWYDHFMIPLLISTVVDFLTGLTILLGVSIGYNLKFDGIFYVLVLLIPAVISFLTGVGYIRRRGIT